MKQPKDYNEALKQIRKLKTEQLLIFIIGILVGAFALLVALNGGL